MRITSILTALAMFTALMPAASFAHDSDGDHFAPARGQMNATSAAQTQSNSARPSEAQSTSSGGIYDGLDFEAAKRPQFG